MLLLTDCVEILPLSMQISAKALPISSLKHRSCMPFSNFPICSIFLTYIFRAKNMTTSDFEYFFLHLWPSQEKIIFSVFFLSLFSPQKTTLLLCL